MSVSLFIIKFILYVFECVSNNDRVLLLLLLLLLLLYNVICVNCDVRECVCVYSINLI